jgi:Peptidase M50B-like
MTLWAWASHATPTVSQWWIVAAVVLGAAIAIHPFTWHYSRLFATYVHEAGHAVVAFATGRRVRRIRLEADTSGTTEHAGAASGLGRLLTAFAGYPAPAFAGWGILVAVGSHHLRWAIAGSFAVLGVLLLFQRSWRGWAVSAIAGVSVYLVVLLPAAVGSVIMALAAGYLLAASPRTVVELHLLRRRAKNDDLEMHSDAHGLAEQTGLPAGLWELLFMAVCGWTVWSAVAGIFTSS